MYYKFKTNIVTDKVLKKIETLGNYIHETIKIKISLASQISCSSSSSTISSISSNEIEGFTINDLNTTKAKQAQIYINNYNTVLKYIKDYSDSIDLSINELLGWHNQIFKNTLKEISCGGKFKTQTNYVIDENKNILFQGVEPSLTPLYMQALIDWYKTSDLPVILKIIVFVADFLMIHPFNDGNGRMSRLIMNYLLIKEGYSLFKYISLEEIILKNKNNYMLKLRTINKVWDTIDCNYSELVEWFLDIFIETSQNYLHMFDISNQFENKRINKQKVIISVINSLNTNHKTINRSNIVNYIKEIDINISEELIKHVLNKLVHEKCLKIEGKGKSTYYLVLNKFDEKFLNAKITKKQI